MIISTDVEEVSDKMGNVIFDHIKIKIKIREYFEQVYANLITT